MPIKINLLKRPPQNKNMVVLGEPKSDYSRFLSKEELQFVKNNSKNGNKLASLNRYSYCVFVQQLERIKPSGSAVEKARDAAVKIIAEAEKLKIRILQLAALDISEEVFLGFLEGLLLSSYQFTKYKTEKDAKKEGLTGIEIFFPGLKQEQIDELSTIVKGNFIARDLVNEPASYLSAVKLSEEVKKVGKEAGFAVEVLGQKKIESLKMGGLLAVNRGSFDPPTFSIMEWTPENAVNKKPYVLVGKGIVFDTGGLSLKPTAGSMDLMKSDMAGGAAVIGTMYAIASQKLPVRVIGLVPATDNRPGRNAYAPQDIIEMHNGMMVEVLNTDAEGRMILADALSYAKKYSPKLVIDLATLTGSAAMAIGQYGTVAMGSAGNEVFKRLIKSGTNVFERIVEFPFWEEYGELIKSDIADIKNVGGREGGAITAGKFLERFTSYPWIHLDIAGPAYVTSMDSYRGKGGTAVGVRLLYDFFKGLACQ